MEKSAKSSCLKRAEEKSAVDRPNPVCLLLDECRALGGRAWANMPIYTLRLSVKNNDSTDDHVNTIEEKELGIMWVLADIDPACLYSARLCVEGKVAKTRVSGKSANCVHQKVVPDSDSKRSWSNKSAAPAMIP